MQAALLEQNANTTPLRDKGKQQHNRLTPFTAMGNCPLTLLLFFGSVLAGAVITINNYHVLLPYKNVRNLRTNKTKTPDL